MSTTFNVISPIDDSVLLERDYTTPATIKITLSDARRAQLAWRNTPLSERKAIIDRAMDVFVANRASIAEEITRQMGRPIRYTPFELDRMVERARYMISVADRALGDITPDPIDGFDRFIRREPVGVVFVIAPWNYPYLTAVNSIVPALLAGNAVILKHSSQTPLCAERFAQAFSEAGLPGGVFQYMHLRHDATEEIISSGSVDFVAFTGSVQGGHAVQRSADERFIGIGLELGGKDPAYVRADADLPYSIAQIVDGAFFNSGQSCCGIERVYVHTDVYDNFVKGFVEVTAQYKLGNPLDTETTLGPMVKASAASAVRKQIEDALTKGATPHLRVTDFVNDNNRVSGMAYLAPQVLTNVDHSMSIMTEETFGPAVGIMRVADDEEAIGLMNDSRYGLTASIWTRDESAALSIGDRLETGTCFMNRCDYLDPALAWTGVKDSGRGCTLSVLGYEQLTRPKSYHMKLKLG
jgi:acyl-CoA reductase-like NAD-dependent aldehyde dehydrogenase